MRRRALEGKLPPPIEALIWHYAKGKLTEQVHLGVDWDKLAARLASARLERD